MTWIEATSSIVRTKQLVHSIILGIPRYWNLSAIFNLDGNIIFNDDIYNNDLSFQMPDPVGLTSRKLYSDTDAGNNLVGYEYKYGPGGKYSIWAVYDFNQSGKVKLTVSGEAGADMGIKIRFSTLKTFTKLEKKIVGGENDDETHLYEIVSGIFFDWSDADAFNVTWAEGDKSITFNVIKGTFSIDPTIQTFATDPYGTTGAEPQQQVWYANGRWWVCYGNGTNSCFDSTADFGSNWKGTTSIMSCNRAYKDSVYWEGTYIYFTTGLSVLQSPGYWVRGTCNADGTITWEATRTTNNTPATNKSYYATCKDYNGYPWVAYAGVSTYYKPYAGRASATDGSGTWGTATLVDSTPTADSYYPVIFPLDSTYMMLAYFYNGASPEHLRFKLYDGASWDTDPTDVADTSIYSFGITNNGATVYFIYTNSTSGDVCCRKYVRGSGLGGEETVAPASDSPRGATCTIDTASGNLHIFFSSGGRYLRYRIRYSDGSYSEATNLVDEGSDVTLGGVASPRQVQNSQIMVCYQTGTANPWYLKAYMLTLGAKDISDSIALSESVKGIQDFELVTVEKSGGATAQTITDVLALSIGTIIKDAGLIETGTLSLADTKLVDKTGLTTVGTLSLADVKLVGKTFTETDVMALADSISATKLFTITDVGTLTELVYKNAGYIITGTTSLSDFGVLNKNSIALDGFTLSDIKLVNKNILLAEAAGLTETQIFNKQLISIDVSSLLDLKLVDANKLVSDVLADSSELLLTNKNLFMTETTSLLETLIYEKNFNIQDAITQAEIYDKSGGISAKTITDSFLSSDAILKDAGNIEIDSVTLADVFIYYKNFILGDALTIADVVKADKNLSILDMLALAEAISIAKAAMTQDSIALAELGVFNKDILKLDTLALSDVKYVGKTITFTETGGLSDVFNLTKETITTDVLSLAEAIFKFREVAAITEAVALGDIEYIDKNLYQAETIALAEFLLSTKLLPIIDDVFFSDEYIALRWLEHIYVDKQLPMTDAFSLAELINVITGELIEIPDSVNFSEIYSIPARNDLSADSVTLSDVKNINKSLFPTDVIAINEVMLALKTLYPQDYVTLQEALLYQLMKQTDDVLHLVDSTSLNKTIPITDAASLVEVLSLVQATKITADALTTADVVGLPSAVKSVLDASTLAELINVIGGSQIQVTDVLGTSDTVLVNLSRVILDDLHLLDVQRQDRVMILSDLLQIVDIIIKEGASAKTVTDIVAMAEAVYIAKQLYETEGISLTEIMGYFFGKNISDIITLSEGISRNKSFLILETITPSELSILDKLLKILDSISASEWVFGALYEVAEGYRIYGQLHRRNALEGHLSRHAHLLGLLMLVEALIAQKHERTLIEGGLHYIEELEGAPPEQTDLSDMITTHKNLLMYDVATISSELILLIRDRYPPDLIYTSDSVLVSLKDLAPFAEDTFLSDTILTHRTLPFIDSTQLDDSVYLYAEKRILDTINLYDVVFVDIGYFYVLDTLSSSEHIYKNAEIILTDILGLVDLEIVFTSGVEYDTISVMDDLILIMKNVLNIDATQLSDSALIVGGSFTRNEPVALTEQFYLNKEILLSEVFGAADVIAHVGLRELIITEGRAWLIHNYDVQLGNWGWRKIAQQFDSLYPVTVSGGTVIFKNEKPSQVWGNIYCRIRHPGDDLENTLIAETVICKAEDVPTEWTEISFHFEESVKITGPWLFCLEFDNPSDVWYFWTQVDAYAPMEEIFLIWQDYYEYWFVNEASCLTCRIVFDIGLDDNLVLAKNTLTLDTINLFDELTLGTGGESRIDYARIDTGVIAFDYAESRIDYATIDYGTIASYGVYEFYSDDYTNSLVDTIIVNKLLIEIESVSVLDEEVSGLDGTIEYSTVGTATIASDIAFDDISVSEAVDVVKT